MPPPRRFLHRHITLGGPLHVLSFVLMCPLLRSLSPASVSVLSLPPECPDRLELKLLDPALEVEDQQIFQSPAITMFWAELKPAMPRFVRRFRFWVNLIQGWLQVKHILILQLTRNG